MGDRAELLARIWDALDPRLRPGLEAELTQARPPLEVAAERRVVLVGHRAAGKSRLLPLLSEWLDWPGVDLDRELEARSGLPLRDWVRRDEASFRRAERELFTSLPGHRVIAAGGGFLSHHGDALRQDVPVLVPISFPTYRERLLADVTRPRLRPDLSLEEELARVHAEREARHALVPTWSLPAFLRATWRDA